MDRATTEEATNKQSEKERLERDIRAVIDDAQSLLIDARTQAESQTAAAREIIRRRIQLLRDRTVETRAALREQAQMAFRVTDRYVHEKPWQAMGIAALLGLAVGFIACRRE